MVHDDNLLVEQPELTRPLVRLLGGGGRSRAVAAVLAIHPTVDALGLVPFEQETDSDTATPAAGRAATVTVPANELWMLRVISGVNATTAVRVRLSCISRAGAPSIVVGDEVQSVANLTVVRNLDRGIPLYPGGSATVSFAAGALNDTTIARFAFQRFSL